MESRSPIYGLLAEFDDALIARNLSPGGSADLLAVTWFLAQFGTPEQKQQWLQPLLDGEIRSAFAMTEPDVASSDATNGSYNWTRNATDGQQPCWMSAFCTGLVLVSTTEAQARTAWTNYWELYMEAGEIRDRVRTATSARPPGSAAGPHD